MKADEKSKPRSRGLGAAAVLGAAAALLLLAGSGAGPASAAAGSAGADPTLDAGPDPLFVPADRPTIPEPARIQAGAEAGAAAASLRRRRVPGPSRKGGTYTARILIKTGVRRAPGGKGIWVARTWTKWSGGAQKLMVLGSRIVKRRLWLKVRLPTRPNGSSGWIPRDRVLLGHSPRYLVIDRSRRVLTIYGRKGKRVARFRVVVGAPSTPTPIGLFALYDRVLQSDRRGFIGPWAVPLTAHSNQLKRYDGGPGLVALHGRAGASFLDPLGSARSHGCVRMNNSRIRQVIKVAKGTAVRIKK